MQHQPNLFSAEPPPDARDVPGRRPGTAAPPVSAGSSPWLRHIEIWVRVVVQLYLGLLIVVLPWLRFWSDNSLFTYSETSATLASSGFVRGLVSGLGLLNLYLAVKEALRWRQPRPDLRQPGTDSRHSRVD